MAKEEGKETDVLEEEDLDKELEDLEGITDEEDDTEPDDSGVAEPKESIESLSAKLESLVKERDGLHREMMSERKTRQELKGQIETIMGLMSEAKEKREAAAPDIEMKGLKGIPVKFDDDGNPFIDPQDLKAIASPDIEAVRKDVSAIKDQTFNQAITSANTEILSRTMAKDDRYPQAFNVLNKAYQYLDNETTRMLNQRRMDPKLTTLDEVLEMMEEEGVADNLATQFPGLDVDMVIEARQQGADGLFSTRKISKALKAIVSSTGDGKEKLNNFKLIASKPNNLAGTRNQKGTAGRTLNDIAEMDFDNISDTDFKKLEKALAGLGI